MKKILIGTTALVAAGMLASPASAASKIKLGLGGFMHQWVGFAQNDSSYEEATGTDYASFDQKSASEIYFTGATKLDNGLTVSAVIQLEGDRGSTGDIDMNFLTVSSASFGKLQLGENVDATVYMQHHAPNVGVSLSVADGGNRIQNWIQPPAAVSLPGPDGRLSNQLTTTFGTAVKSNKVNYLSPRFSGFGLAASYTPSFGNDSQTQPNRDSGETSAYSLSASYDGDFNGAKVGANVNYRKQHDGLSLEERGVAGSASNDFTTWMIGGSIGYAGFTVGGSYSDHNQEDDDMVMSAAGVGMSFDGHIWDLGLAYKTGPYSLSLTWLHAEAEGSMSDLTAGQDDDEDETDLVAMSGNYNMGPGVDLKASLLWADYDNGDDNANTTNADENNGWAIVTGLKLTF